jgi:hypothetical protein
VLYFITVFTGIYFVLTTNLNIFNGNFKISFDQI